MRCTLDQLYERLLFTYPPAYRAERGDELVATAVELASPDRRLPELREALGLVVGGLRTRSRLARLGSRAMPWADGLRLGAALVMALAFAGQINNLLFTTTLGPHLLPAAMIGVIVALLRAPRRIWLLLVALGLGFTWGHVTGAWSMVAIQGPAGGANPVVIAGNILPWVVPFVLAGVAFVWQPRGDRGPAVWPWWFVGLLTFLPSIEVLKGVSTARYSVPALAVTAGLAQLLWPFAALVLAFLIRDVRLGVAVATWACGSLFTSPALFFLLAAPGPGWALNPATVALACLAGALAVTAAVDRRLARI